MKKRATILILTSFLLTVLLLAFTSAHDISYNNHHHFSKKKIRHPHYNNQNYQYPIHFTAFNNRKPYKNRPVVYRTINFNYYEKVPIYLYTQTETHVERILRRNDLLRSKIHEVY